MRDSPTIKQVLESPFYRSHGRLNAGQYFVALARKNQLTAEWYYGDSYDDAFNKAALYLITLRLKS